MNQFARLAVAAAALAFVPAWAQNGSPPLDVVAAENFYGDVAQQIGGPAVKVTSILSNPDQDPHLFEASPSTARALATAKLVIYNGADYDPWMVKLLSASKTSSRKTIVVADLVNKKAGDNPHLWYDPVTIPAVAKKIATDLATADSTHQAGYEQRLRTFTESLQPLDAKIKAIRQKYAGTPVTATEPVFGYMALALGLEMRNEGFQLAVMNDTEPSASAIAAFQDDLKSHQVKVLFYNTQATGDLTQRMQRIARESKVPVVGITETAPPGQRYQDWMMDQLDALEAALVAAPK